METMHRKNSRGTFKIEIWEDENCPNPRENDNLATIACFHRRYDIGDKHPYSIEEIAEAERTGFLDGKKIIHLPVYGYDHGGMVLDTKAFSCPWDSGKLGIVFVTEERAREELGWDRLNAARRERIAITLGMEVRELSKWMQGDTWGYTVTNTDTGEEEECGGYIGRDYLDSYIRNRFPDPIEKLLNIAKGESA